LTPFKFIVEPAPDTREQMVPLLDQEVSIFNRYLQEQGLDPLLRIEETMLRTYLTQKFRGRLEGDPVGGARGHSS